MEKDKRFISTFIITSLCYIGLGLMFLLAPGLSQRLICYLLGAAAMVVGIMRIVFYFLKNDLSRAFENDLAIGVVLLIAGVYLFTQPEAIWNWVPVILGFSIVFDSIIKLQQSFDLRRGNFSAWWLVFIIAIATFVLGLLLIMNTFSGDLLFYYLGIVLIVDGSANLLSLLLLSIIRKKVQKNAEKAEKEKKSGHSKPDEHKKEEAHHNAPAPAIEVEAHPVEQTPPVEPAPSSPEEEK